MSNPNYHIPDDMASEVLAEAARLHMEANKGYSLTELQQVGLELEIPPEVIERAVKIVEQKRKVERIKKEQARERFKQQVQSFKQQVQKSIQIGISLLIPTALIYGTFIFLPKLSTLVQLPDLQNREQESRMMLRDDFQAAVVGKTKQQVIQAVGKPNRTSDSGDFSHWYYEKKTKDSITGKVDARVSVFFMNGIAEGITSYDYDF